MACHIFIVTSMLIAGLATSAFAAPSTPLTPLTPATCGISKPCGINDTYSILCPASQTCNEYYKCENGVVSIHICHKAFYLFWMAPVYDSAKNCCKLVYSFHTTVRPDENGLCPSAAAEHTGLSKDTNAHVKRHAEPSAPAVLAGAANAEPTKETPKEEVKSVEPTSQKEPADEQNTTKAEQQKKPETKDGKRVASSARGATVAPLATIVITILFNVLSIRH